MWQRFRQRFRQWARRALLVVGALAVLLAVGHRPLLRGLAGTLICDESGALEGDAVGVEAVEAIVLGGDRALPRAMTWHAQGRVARVAILREPPDRLRRAGVLPDDVALFWHEADRLGLPTAHRVVVAIPVRRATLQEKLRQLSRHWSQSGAASTSGKRGGPWAVLLVDRFDSGRVRALADRTLPAEMAARVLVVGLPDRRFDETDWWHDREGWKAVFGGLVRRLSDHLLGEDPPLPPEEEWDR